MRCRKKAASTLLLLKRSKRKQLVHMRVKRSRKVITGAAVVGLIAAGGAFGYWLATGSGTGSATTGDSQGMTISQTGPAVAGLTPGGVPQDISGTINNPNTFGVLITGIYGSVTSVDTTSGTCDVSNFKVTGPAKLLGETFPFTVPKGTTTAWHGLTIELLDLSGVDQSGCKNAKANLAYTTVKPQVQLPALETRTRTSTGSATVVVYIHHSGNYVIQPGDRLVLVSTTGGIGRSIVLATADVNGNIYYTGPTTVGNAPTDTVTSEVYGAGASLTPGTPLNPNPGQHWVGIGF